MVMAMMVHPAPRETCARSSPIVTGVDRWSTAKAPYPTFDVESPRLVVVYEYAQRKRLIGARPEQRALGAGGVL